jgi:hypothetical protein
MEKKGDLLNQLAIISDLSEKMNINSKSTTMVIELDESTYLDTFNYFLKKYKNKSTNPGKTFTIKLGVVDIVFNKSNDETTQFF